MLAPHFFGGRLMNRTIVFLASVIVVVTPLTASEARAQVTETYVFRDTMEPTEGAGNVLEPVHNGTGAILTGGAGFVDGMYVTHTISPSACASAPTVRAWAFPVSGGLRHANVAPAIVTGSYSVSMLMRYNPMDAGYARLVDFSNSTADTGIYKLGDGVSFYPVGTYAPGSFVADQDVFVTITRDATSQLVSLFINGVASGTYVDTGNLYAPATSAMYFLMDNTTGSAAISETDPGVISYLQVRSTPMTSVEVVDSLADICNTVACGDGNLDLGEACDDGGVVAGDGCSSACKLEMGWVCAGEPSTCSLLCGNGTVDSVDGEECDDGNMVDGDGCSALCTIEVALDAGIADAGLADAGDADAGSPDAGIADAGRADGGPPADASARGDASIEPRTEEGGCGCLTVGSGRRHGWTGLASLALLGFVAARRARKRRA